MYSVVGEASNGNFGNVTSNSSYIKPKETKMRRLGISKEPHLFSINFLKTWKYKNYCLQLFFSLHDDWNQSANWILSLMHVCNFCLSYDDTWKSCQQNFINNFLWKIDLNLVEWQIV